MDTLIEFIVFAWKRKKIWMWPLLLALLLVGFVFLAGSNPALMPFVYTLF